MPPNKNQSDMAMANIEQSLMAIAFAIQNKSVITSAANTGAGAGTYTYVTLGGIKFLWGSSAAYAVGAGATADVVVNFPTGFFLAVPSGVSNVWVSIVSEQYTNIIGISTTSATLRTKNSGASTATANYLYYMFMGT